MIVHVVEPAAHGLQLHGMGPPVAVGEERLATHLVAEERPRAIDKTPLDVGDKRMERDDARPLAADALQRHRASRRVLLVREISQRGGQGLTVP